MCVLDVSARFAWSVRGVCTAWYVQQISCVCVRAMCVCKRSCVCPCDVCVCAQGSSCVWRGEWCDEACMILIFTTNPNDVHHIRHEVLRVTRTFTTVVTACLFSQGSVTHTTSKNPRRKRLPSNGDVGPFAYEHMRVPQMARLISAGQTRSSRQPQLLQPLVSQSPRCKVTGQPSTILPGPSAEKSCQVRSRASQASKNRLLTV